MDGLNVTTNVLDMISADGYHFEKLMESSVHADDPINILKPSRIYLSMTAPRASASGYGF